MQELAVTYLKNFLMNTAELSTQPLMRMFSLKHEFSTEWNKFLYPVIVGSDQSLAVTLKKEHFPFFTKNRSIDVSKIDAFMKSTRTGEYKMILKATDLDDNPMTSSEISMPENATFANMQKATFRDSTASFNTEEINIMLPLILKFRHN